jgi:hypothetical protein
MKRKTIKKKNSLIKIPTVPTSKYPEELAVYKENKKHY